MPLQPALGFSSVLSMALPLGTVTWPVIEGPLESFSGSLMWACLSKALWDKVEFGRTQAFLIS